VGSERFFHISIVRRKFITTMRVRAYQATEFEKHNTEGIEARVDDGASYAFSKR